MARPAAPMQPREALLGLMRQGRYDDALAQLAQWPPGGERDWFAGSCHLHRGDHREAERLLAPLARDPHAPAASPLSQCWVSEAGLSLAPSIRGGMQAQAERLG